MSAPIIYQSFQLIWMEFGMLLTLVGVMNLVLILFCAFNTYVIFACIESLPTDFFQTWY